jgi:TatD DNase family protein
MLHELGNLPWINIHTHHKPAGHDEWIIRNAYLGSPKSILPEGYFFSCGIHPWWAVKESLNIMLNRVEQALQNTSCIALGECGLDRLRGPHLSIQKEVFESQIELALKYQKPLIIHSVRAHQEVIQMLPQSSPAVIIHGFNGGKKLALDFLSKGCSISIGPRFLRSLHLQNCLPILPLDKLYFETDTESTPIKEVYTAFANAANLNLASLRQQIWTNFTRDFTLGYGT